MPPKTRTLSLSLGIIAVAVGLAYVPTPVPEKSVVVLSGTELQEPLTQLEAEFEAAYPSIDISLKFQGSRDIVTRYIDQKDDFDPTVLIPANGELLGELRDRWSAQSDAAPFYGAPQAIAKTMLVAVVWPERGNVLFPKGTFDWNSVENALEQGQWDQIGGDPSWGSFDLVMTDPTRSNSGQLALSLWSQEKAGGRSLTTGQLGTTDISDLLGLVKRSVYQPPRSTDTLLQEFITRGPNDADIAFVYESIALHRWSQSSINHGRAYQVYYLDPTFETVATAAIVTRNVNQATANAAQQFLDFLAEPEQQSVFVQFGFRPTQGNVDLQSVENSPWSQPIPGLSTASPSASTTPEHKLLAEIIRLWQRAQ